MAETKFIISYVLFFTGIALFGYYGAMGLDGELASDVPSLPDNELGLFGYLLDVVAYFFLLGGLVTFGVSAVWAAAIGIVFNIILAYVIARLLRGGG